MLYVLDRTGFKKRINYEEPVFNWRDVRNCGAEGTSSQVYLRQARNQSGERYRRQVRLQQQGSGKAASGDSCKGSGVGRKSGKEIEQRGAV